MYLQHSVDFILKTSLSYSPSGSVLFEIKSAAGSTLVSGTASTGPSTTLIADVSADSDSLSVADGSSFEVGDEIEIYDSDGGSEIAIISSASASSLNIRYPITRSFSSGDIIKSRRCEINISSTDITSAYNNARIEFSYSDVDGIEHSESQPLQITKYDPVCPVTEQDLLRRLPVARNLVDSEQPLSDLIHSVWENDVLGELSVSLPVTALVSSQSLSSSLIYAIAFELYRNAGRFEEADSYRDSYERSIERIVNTIQKDTDSDGSTEDELTISRRVSKVLWG